MLPDFQNRAGPSECCADSTRCVSPAPFCGNATSGSSAIRTELNAGVLESGSVVGSLDLKRRAAGISGNQSPGAAIHEQIEVFEHDRANQCGLSFWLYHRTEGSMTTEDSDGTRFWLWC
jgi:hypothetical protein